MPRRTASVFALSAIVCFFVLVFRGVVFGGESFVCRDISAYYYPMWHLVARTLQAGALPLWDPYSAFGAPLLANVQTCVFYPPHLIFLIADYTRAFNVVIVLHIVMAAFFTYLWLRSLGASLYASLLSGLIFALSGYVMSAINLTISLQSVAYFPLALLCFRRALRLSGLRYKVEAAGVLTLQFLAGDPAISFATCFTLLAAVVFLTVEDRMRTGRWGAARVGTGAIVLALFAALSAFKIIPFAELLAHSDRINRLTWDEKMRWSVPLSDLIGAFIPSFEKIGLFFQDYWTRQAWLDNYYAGVGTLALAVVGISAFRRDRRAAQHLLLLLLGITLALGRFSPIYVVLHRVFPLLGLVRYPVRFLFLFHFAAACLAGLGADRLLRQSRSARPQVLWYGLGIMSTAALAVFCRRQWSGVAKAVFHAVSSAASAAQLKAAGPKALADAALAVSGNAGRTMLFLTMMLAIIAMLRTTRAPRALSGALLFLTVLTDLAGANILEPRVSAGDWGRVTPSLGVLLEDRTLYRAMASPRAYDSAYFLTGATLPRQLDEQKNKLAPNIPAEFGIYDAISYDSIFLSTTFSVREQFSTLKTASQGRFIEMLNIKYVASPSGDLGDSFTLASANSDANLFRCRTVMPRAFLVARAVREVDAAKIFDRLKSDAFDPRSELFVPDHGDSAGSDGAPGPDEEVLMDSYAPGRIQLRTVSSSARWLFLSDTYYPGWSAAIDGSPAEIHRANEAFRAVRVPAGKHEVEFVYRPLSFMAGRVISMAALILACLLLLRGKRVISAN